MAQVLSRVSNGDGTTTVTVNTANWGQGQVIVDDAALDDPATEALLDHVANIHETAYTAVRRSRRDAQRYGG